MSSPTELALLALVLFVAALIAWHALTEGATADAGLTYLGGVRAWATGRPESLSTWISTPFLAMSAASLSVFVNQREFATLVVLADIAAAFALVVATWTALRPRVSASWWWATLLLACGFAPFASSLWWKQVSILAFASAILGFGLVRRGQDRTGGLFVALSIAIKPVVILLPLSMLLKRETRRSGIYTLSWGALLLAASQIFLAWRGHSLALLSPIGAIQSFSAKSDPAVNGWSCHPENFAPLSMSCRLVGGGDNWGMQHIVVLAIVLVLTVVVVDTMWHIPGSAWAWLALSFLLSPMFSPIAWSHYQLFLAPTFLLLAYQFRGRATLGLWLLLGAAFVLAELIWRPLGTFTSLLPGERPETVRSMFPLMTLSMFSQYLLLAVALNWFSRLRPGRSELSLTSPLAPVRHDLPIVPSG